MSSGWICINLNGVGLCLRVPRRSNVLLVTLLDGRIVGLDKQNGARLWTYDSGAPLVSVKQTEADSEAVTVFPGVDGSLYAYHNRPSGPQRLEVRYASQPQHQKQPGQQDHARDAHRARRAAPAPNILPSAFVT